jgi:predicted signal transduction protein with EAL and GGDEF domain
MVSNLQSDVIKLAEQVMVLVEQVKNRPVVEGANVESALRTLKALGATVTITLPA